MKKSMAVGVVLLFLGTSISVLAQSSDRHGASQRYTTLYVGGSGPGNYSKIQDAIDAAAFGDTVFVYSQGSPYMENVVVNQSIILEGEDKDTTIIDAGQRGNGTVLLASCAITGFTIRNTSGNWTASLVLILSDGNTIADNILNGTVNGNMTMTTGITVRGDENFIARNIITGTWRSIGLYNASTTYITDNILSTTGIYLEGSPNTQIRNNRFSDILVNELYMCKNSGNCLVVNNSFNATLMAVQIYDSENVVAFENTFEGGSTGVIVYSDQVNISKNSFRNGNHGIEINRGDYNIIYGNRFWNNDYAIVYTGNGSHGQVRLNNISNCRVGMAISMIHTDNLFTRNELRHNDLGIQTEIFRSAVTITENNFVENNRSLFFTLIKPFHAQAPGSPCIDGNYYQELRFGWKLIYGINLILKIQLPHHYPFYIILPWFIFDKHPAKTPFEINTP